MKVSVLTPTYNRANLLGRLYKSLLQNKKDNIEIEWLIMDDSSTDNTKEIAQKWIEENKIAIVYSKQEHQGKMIAINNLVEKATGDVIIECDSDDYFTNDAFSIIEEAWQENRNRTDCYAMCFLKYDQNNENMGKLFPKKETTMFDLYFKDGETGEKALVFFSEVRKKYKHKLEKQEKFVTEARMYHEMDLKYKMICINKPIMVCEYQEDGYTKNIKKQFMENPYGYFEYFKEIFKQDMKNVLFKKRLYVIKHYILFSYLTKAKNPVRNVKGGYNKFLYLLLCIPGTIKSKRDYNCEDK